MGAIHSVLILIPEFSGFFDIGALLWTILMFILFLPLAPELLLLTDYARYLRNGKKKRALLTLAGFAALEMPLLIMALIGDGAIVLFFLGGNMNAFLLWLSMRYYGKHLDLIPNSAVYAALNLASFVITWLLPIYLDIPVLALGWLLQILFFLFFLADISKQKFQQEDVRIPVSFIEDDSH